MSRIVFLITKLFADTYLLIYYLKKFGFSSFKLWLLISKVFIIHNSEYKKIGKNERKFISWMCAKITLWQKYSLLFQN